MAEEDDDTLNVLGLFSYLSLWNAAVGVGGAWAVVLKILVLLLFTGLVSLCFVLLGSTADDFFLPTLGRISEKLRLSPELAGVTLLSLGNGSPDLFATTASFMKMKNDEQGIGGSALLGGALLLLTIVLGSVCLASPGSLQVEEGIIMRDVGFFAVTVIWIIVCAHAVRRIGLSMALSFFGIYGVYVIAVFVYDLWRKKWKRRLHGIDQDAQEMQPMSCEGHQLTHARWFPTNDVLTEHSAELNRADQEYFLNRQGGVQNDSDSLPDDQDHDHPDIIMDYHALPESSPNLTDNQDNEESSEVSFNFSGYVVAWQLAARRSQEVMNPSSCKAAIKKPFDLMRKFTIPLTGENEEEWSKPRSVSQPFLATVFLLFVFGAFERGNEVVYVPALAIGFFMTLLFQFLLHRSIPPSNKTLTSIMLTIGFISSISWIYVVANELVSILTALGIIFGVQPSILGLTILAMGNSAGDLVANTALARAKKANMAIAGCFGGPLLNLLLGFGLSFLIVTLQGKKVLFELDAISTLAAVFILITLLLIVYKKRRLKQVAKLLFVSYATFICFAIVLIIAGKNS